MIVNLYRITNRKTGEVVAEGTMTELAKIFEVDRTAIFQAANRGSHFLRIYKVEKLDNVNTIR